MNADKQKLGLNTITEYDRMIEKELNKLAVYRTVEGVVFQSVEEAKSAKKDLKKFYECICMHGIASESLRKEIGKQDILFRDFRMINQITSIFCKRFVMPYVLY